MKIEVDIRKKYALGIIAGLLILTGIIGIYALGVVPNPGHPLSGIQGYFNDANLEVSLGQFCQTGGTNCPAGLGGGTLDTGWFIPHDAGNFAQFGDLFVTYNGFTTGGVSFQEFRVKDVNPATIKDIRLLVTRTGGAQGFDFSSSFDCNAKTVDQGGPNYLDRPFLLCEEINSAGGVSGLVGDLTSYPRAQIKARIIITTTL